MTEREVDHLLVQKAQAGDEAAFSQLVIKYQRKLSRLVSRLVRNSGEAEEVVQEAFIKAFRALPNFRGDSAFYTWLYRIGINTAKNHLLTASRRVQTLSDYDSDDAEHFVEPNGLHELATPESILQSKQIAETVNRAMNNLPDELRTAITLREIEGCSYEEIAEQMGCPIGTVRSRIFRAREAISAELRPMLDLAPDRRW
ncbi:MAG: polymerase sigma factor RpoE [Pseudomonadota bacterium]|jgi:RNA polymerase sigma factor RpoE